MAKGGLFLPYQERWIKDRSKIKICEKARRTGFTWCQSYEDTEDGAKGLYDIWFSSADDSAAQEYIEYCKHWAKIFNAPAEYLGEVLVDDKDITAYRLKFKNGKRITAMSSNPKRFRSKGGKVVLDEFAFHEQADALWKAARPVITWGFPLRILSTHNGKSCLYHTFVERVKKGELKWSHHKTDIFTAVNEGLYDKIIGRPTTPAERRAWLDELRADCGDENTWLQEYCCVPVDETAAFLTYEMLRAVERPAEELLTGLEDIRGDLYVGCDVGRRRDLFVLWGIEKMGSFKSTRFITVLERQPFDKMKEELWRVLAHPNLRRCCIDETGLGMQLAEEAQQAFGRYRVEGVTISGGKVKEELAYGLLREVQDRTFHIPADRAVREDLHSIKKIVTIAGNVRFDVARNETDGHADRFMAAALALHAVDANAGPVSVTTRRRFETAKLAEAY